jgi:hypothetical protein
MNARSLISKMEIGAGVALIALCLAHVGWCRWSLPRHGVRTSHGIETAACNWGTSLTDIIVGAIAALTLLSGLVGHRLQSKTMPWYLAQVPAIVAWGWLAYGSIYSLLIYPY